MVKTMENEEEVFRAWLYKFVKKDKIIKGNSLAKKIGVTNPTLSGYHSGRMIDGERKFPAIPFKVRQAILAATGVTHEEMMEIGRAELNTGEKYKFDSEQIVSDVVKVLEKRNLIAHTDLNEENPCQVCSITDPVLKKHHDLLDQFPEEIKEKALEMNEKAVKLARLSPEALQDIIDYIELKTMKAEKQQLKATTPEKATGTDDSNSH